MREGTVVECRPHARRSRLVNMARVSLVLGGALVALALWAVFLLMLANWVVALGAHGNAGLPKLLHLSSSPHAARDAERSAPPSVLLGVFSMGANALERAAFRRSLHHPAGDVPLPLTLRFVLGDYQWNDALVAENNTFGDLMVLRNIGENMNDGEVEVQVYICIVVFH